LERLESGELLFKDVLAYIGEHYEYTASAFWNGGQHNTENENQGSARILSFAQLHGLSEADTLTLFAEHYASVLAEPDGTGHQNIRQFRQSGWGGVKFERRVLVAKKN